MTSESVFELREGDNAGGYWGQIYVAENPETVVATVYNHEMALEILGHLNDRSQHPSDCACLICEPHFGGLGA